MTTYLEFAARGKTGWWRYIVAFALAGAIAVFVGALIVLCLEWLLLVPNNFAAALTKPAYSPAFFLGTATIFGAVLAGAVIAIALIQGKRFGDVIGTWKWVMFCRGAAIWAMFLIAATVLDFLIAPHDFKITWVAVPLLPAISAVFGLSIQTFAEEFIFRGYLTQGLLLATKRPLAAAILSGLLFGGLHTANGAPQAVSAVFFGIFTALIAIETGGIAFSYGLHLINNLFAAMIIVSADDIFNGSPGFIIQNTPDLLWWDVGVTVLGLMGTLWLITRKSKSNLLSPCRAALE